MLGKRAIKTTRGNQTSLVGFLSLLLFALLTVLFFSLGNHTVYESKPFLAVINIVFLSALPFAVAHITTASYLKSGLLQLLFLGGAMITFGICNLIAAWGIIAVSTPTWTNFLVTVHNVGALVFAVITFVASIIFSLKKSFYAPNSKRRKMNLTLAYVSAVILAVILAVLTLSQDIPSFVVSGSFTLLRQSVLVLAIVLLALSSILFGKKYLGSKSSIVYWYSLGLALIGIGLLDVLIEPTLGTLLSWTGRAAQYVGCVFFVVAALSKLPRSSVNENWVEAFSSDRNQLTNLFAKMLDGFAYQRIFTNVDGKPVDYVFLEVNDAFEKDTGLKRENIIGKKVTEVLPGIENDPAGWIDIYGRVALTGVSVQFENYSLSLDKWFKVSAYSPEKGYFVTLFDDITERKKSEKTLAENEERLQHALDAGELGLWGLDISTGKAWRTLRHDQIFGYKELLPEWTYQIFLGHVVPEDRVIVDEKFGRALSSGTDWNFECRIQTPDGLKRWIWAQGKPKFNDNHQVVQMIGLVKDITERKKAEEAVRVNEERFRSVLNNSLDVIYRLNLQSGNYEYMSPASKTLLGFEPEELMMMSNDEMLSRVHPDDLPLLQSALSKANETGKANCEYRFLGKDGNYSWWSNQMVVSKDPEGKPIYRDGFVRDVTERKKAEEVLEEYQKNLEKLVEDRTKQLKNAERLAAIGATAGMVGHDIRNPLQAIISDVYLVKTELASTGDNSEEKKNALESLEEIEKNIDYINKIVQDLQDYARPLNPQAEETDIKSVIEKLLTKNGLPKNVKVNLKVADDVKKIGADSYYINRIMYNLITNSVQAMPNGGKLSIQVYKETDNAVITIKDTGIGIPKDVQNKMFTPMFTTKSKGQGFGLPVVKRMTESLGGTVTFESEEGKGTTFIIRLPQSQ
jgi:PAS domain S-box-containing protein